MMGRLSIKPKTMEISLAWFAAIKFPRKRKGLAGNLEMTHWYAGPPAETPIL